jgi:signal transduction histidine kinase
LDALAGAIRESLTNVRKHAGVDRAVVRVTRAGGDLVVTVLDRGVGMDQATTLPGVGLTRSVTERIAQAGGTARITSAPGEGTCVELRVPAGGASRAAAGLVGLPAAGGAGTRAVSS